MAALGLRRTAAGDCLTRCVTGRVLCASGHTDVVPLRGTVSTRLSWRDNAGGPGHQRTRRVSRPAVCNAVHNAIVPCTERAEQRDRNVAKSTTCTALPVESGVSASSKSLQPGVSTVLGGYEAARRALELAASVDEVKRVRDQTVAVAAYARQAQDNELLRWASEIRLRAERRAGELLANMPKNTGRAGHGRPNLGGAQRRPPKMDPPTLAELGINKKQSSLWQSLARIPEEQFEQCIDAEQDAAAGMSARTVLRYAATTGKNTYSDEWYTPSPFIEAARATMTSIDVDPASCALANETVRATQFFTSVDDGLKQRWHGNVWLNPPFSDPLLGRFLDALISKYRDGEFTQACTLLNNSTESPAFQKMAAAAGAACFPRGRLRFVGPAGRTPANRGRGRWCFISGRASSASSPSLPDSASP